MLHPVGSHAAGRVTVERVFTLNGDYNADGRVDAADYIVWRKNDGTPAGHSLWRTNFGRTGPPPAALGDFNADGSINAADYIVWRKTDGTPAGYKLWQANFGPSGAGSDIGSATATVPEPRTAWLLIFAAVRIVQRRRRS
jgi:hypothetical protein